MRPSRDAISTRSSSTTRKTRERLGERVAELRENALDEIDRISRHYTGQPYSDRERGRVSARIEIESWHAWAIGRPWTGSQ